MPGHATMVGRGVGVYLFSQETSNRTTGNGLRLHQGRFRLGIRKNLFTRRVVKRWDGEVSHRPCRHVDVVLRDMVCAGLGSSGLMVELNLKVFSNLNDSTINKGLGNVLEWQINIF